MRCRDCGTETKSCVCDECETENKRIRDRLRIKKKYKHKIDADALLIVKDPDPLGGFSKGAVINKYEATCMCRKNHASFTIGTELMDCKGQVYQVVALPDGNQKLNRIGD